MGVYKIFFELSGQKIFFFIYIIINIVCWLHFLYLCRSCRTGEENYGGSGAALAWRAVLGQGDLRGPVEGHGPEHPWEPAELRPPAPCTSVQRPGTLKAPLLLQGLHWPMVRNTRTMDQSQPLLGSSVHWLFPLEIDILMIYIQLWTWDHLAPGPGLAVDIKCLRPGPAVDLRPPGSWSMTPCDSPRTQLKLRNSLWYYFSFNVCVMAK